MQLFKLSLVALAAPVILLTHGHFSRRTLVALIGAMLAPAFLYLLVVTLAATAIGVSPDAIFPHDPGSGAVLLVQLQFVPAAMAISVLHWFALSIVEGWPGAGEARFGYGGKLVGLPLTFIGVVYDILRIFVILWLLGPKPEGYELLGKDGFLEALMTLPIEYHPHLGVFAAIAVIVIGLARKDGGMLPGLGKAPAVRLSLFGVAVRMARPSVAVAGLSSLLSRRPAALQAIAQRSDPRRAV